MAATDGGVSRVMVRALLAAFGCIFFFLGCRNEPSFVLEKTIALPDSLGGPSFRAIAYSEHDNRILVGLQNGRVLVLDAATGRKLAQVPSVGPGAPVYDPVTDQVCLSDSMQRVTVDARWDSLLSDLVDAKMDRPQEICSDPVAGRIYCYLHRGSDSLTVLDSRTLAVVATIPTEQGAGGRSYRMKAICDNPKMHRVYWVQAGSESLLRVVDARSSTVIESVRVERAAVPLCYNQRENKLYVSGFVPSHSTFKSKSFVSVLDCSSNRVVAVLPERCDGMCFGLKQNKVYGLGGDTTVVVIDGVSDRVIARVRVPYRPDDLVYDSTGNRIYCGGMDWVAAIDCRGDTLVGSIRTSTKGLRSSLVLCPAVNKLYSLQWDTRELYAIDCARFTVASRTTLGYHVGALLYNGGLDKVYCANVAGDAVAVIDAKALSVRSIVHVGRRPRALCCNSNGAHVYCANEDSRSVSVIDAIADTVVAAIGMRFSPAALCYSALHDKVYCAGWGTHRGVAVIDCRTNSVVKVLDVPVDLGSHFFYDSRRDRVYVMTVNDIEQRSLDVIDARRDTLVAVPRDTRWPTGREEPISKLGSWATSAVTYAPRHRRAFVGSDDGSVVVLRDEGPLRRAINRVLSKHGKSVPDERGSSVLPVNQTRSRH